MGLTTVQRYCDACDYILRCHWATCLYAYHNNCAVTMRIPFTHHTVGPTPRLKSFHNGERLSCTFDVHSIVNDDDDSARPFTNDEISEPG